MVLSRVQRLAFFIPCQFLSEVLTHMLRIWIFFESGGSFKTLFFQISVIFFIKHILYQHSGVQEMKGSYSLPQATIHHVALSSAKIRLFHTMVSLGRLHLYLNV